MSLSSKNLIQSAPKLSTSQVVTYAAITLWMVMRYTLPVFQTGHTDRVIWQHYGLGGIYLTFNLLNPILIAAALYLFGRRMKPGYLVANILVLINATIFITGQWLASRDLGLYQKAYAQSRQLRGAPIDQARLDAIVNPQSSQIILYGGLIIFAILLLILYLLRHKYTHPFSLARLFSH